MSRARAVVALTLLAIAFAFIVPQALAGSTSTSPTVLGLLSALASLCVGWRWVNNDRPTRW